MNTEQPEHIKDNLVISWPLGKGGSHRKSYRYMAQETNFINYLSSFFPIYLQQSIHVLSGEVPS